MIKLKYKSWEDITIPIYQEIIDIAKSGEHGEEAFTHREMDILAVLCDSDRESLGDLLIEDYTKLAHEARFLQKMPFYIPPQTIILRGVEYRIVVDIAKFTLAQYAEYNTLRADVKTNVSQILACLFIPTTAKVYADNYDVKEVVEAIEAELPYYKAHGILHFFQAAQSLSLANTLRLEAKRLKKMARKMEDRAEKHKVLKEAEELHKAYISLGRCWLNK